MSVALAFLFSLVLTGWLASRRAPLSILDHPNDRSLHVQPVPRTGGIAIVSAMAVGYGWLWMHEALPSGFGAVALAVLFITAVSLLDDLQNLSPWVRLGAHLLAAIGLVGQGVVLFEGWTGMVLSVLGLVWMLNLYNFMDGMDGLAGGMSLSGFGFLGLAGWLSGDLQFAVVCWTIAAAAAGFLIWNFPPARIFMGDVGSTTLGLLAGVLSLWGGREALFSWWYPLLVFSPFIVDATATLLRRLRSGEKVWEAHRSHYYQRLVQMGWGHRKTVLWEYGLMALCALVALWALRLPPIGQWGVLAALGLVYGLAMLGVEYGERRAKGL